MHLKGLSHQMQKRKEKISGPSSSFWQPRELTSEDETGHMMNQISAASLRNTWKGRQAGLGINQGL